MHELVGGHVALDLVNTVAWRLDRDRTDDRAADLPSLVDWGVAAGAWEPLPAPHPVIAATSGVVRQAHAVREATYDALTGSDAAAALGVLHAAYLAALRRARVDGPPLRWHVPVTSVADIPAALALHAVDLLRSDDVRRMRQCADDACGWLFLDATRNHSRRWCSSADCGNRARARRHYARRRAATT